MMHHIVPWTGPEGMVWGGGAFPIVKNRLLFVN
jgi:hypothetical protein